MLEGKIVSVSRVEMLSFCYPTFIPSISLNEWTMQKNVLYTGSYYSNLINDLHLYTKQFICVGYPHEVSLHTRKDWMSLAYQKHNKKIPKHAIESYDVLEEDEFWSTWKTLWVCGKWSPKTVASSSFFSLFKSILLSQTGFLKEYFLLRKEYSFLQIESAFLTFLSRVNHVEDSVGISPGYRQILIAVKRAVGHRMKKAIQFYLSSPKTEMYFLSFAFMLFQNS